MISMRWLGIALLCVLAACGRSVPKLPTEPIRTESWDPEFVAKMASVPVQTNGRVKPLSVWAAFTLYNVHGRRDLKYSVGEGESLKKFTLEPTEWLLDVWCFPDQAANYPLFRVEHTGVMDALGLANDGQRPNFEYLTYAEIEDRPNNLARLKKLKELAESYAAKDQKDRDEVQEHILQLWSRWRTYDRLQRQMMALHYSVPVEDAEVKKAFGGERVRLAGIAANVPEFRRITRAAGGQLENASADLMRVLKFVSGAVENDTDGAGLVPPLGQAAATPDDGNLGGEEQEPAWLTLGGAFESAMSGNIEHPVAALTHLQRAMTASAMTERTAALLDYRQTVLAAAQPFSDQEQIERETYYYIESWHYRAIHWFLFGFVLAAICWVVPRNRLLWLGSLGVTGIGLGMLVFDIYLRCVITERPPIKNLYDTFLFIGAINVLVLMIVEIVYRRRIALAAAPALGALLVMFGRMFEVSKGEDTMDPLVAVLDSNFWLATHVTTINIGYAAGLGAAALANVWILMRVLRIQAPRESGMKELVRMIYGVTCFGLIFSVVGTILGGVWANDSWGRFWGWDPKENGALMICLSQIAVLHARMSGWVRDFGFVIWSAITGIVVVFSWFHVNLLGIGLHSYGFSGGLRDAVWTCYVVQLAAVGIGTIDVLLRPDPVPRGVADGEAPPLPTN